MLRKQNQADIVVADGGIAPDTITEKIRIPGIETLHEKEADEIAEVLSIVLRSRAHIKELRYIVGEHIELTILRP